MHFEHALRDAAIERSDRPVSDAARLIASAGSGRLAPAAVRQTTP
jgi:hypothetical protein